MLATEEAQNRAKTQKQQRVLGIFWKLIRLLPMSS